MNRLVVLAREAGDDRHWLADRSAVHERYENHLVPVQGTAIPTAVLTYKGAVSEGRRQVLTFAEHQAERADVGTQAIVGLDRLSDEVRPLWVDSNVNMTSPIAVGPAVEAARPDRGQIIGDEVGIDLVALVDDGEQLMRLRLERHPGRVARAGSEDALRAGQPVDLVNGSTSLLDG